MAPSSARQRGGESRMPLVLLLWAIIGFGLCPLTNSQSSSTTVTQTTPSVAQSTVAPRTPKPSPLLPTVTTTQGNASLLPAFAGDDPSFWEEYRWYLIAAAAGLVVFVVAAFLLRRLCCRGRCCRRSHKRTTLKGFDTSPDAAAVIEMTETRNLRATPPPATEPPKPTILHTNLDMAVPNTAPAPPVPSTPSTTATGLIDPYAPAHLHGYRRPHASLEELQVLETLDVGQFGETKRALFSQYAHQASPKAVMVTLPAHNNSRHGRRKEDTRLKLLQDAWIRSQFRHPKIIGLIGLVLDEGAGPVPWLVREHASAGKLDKYLRKHAPSPDVLLGFCRDIAEGVNYLACCDFVLGDLTAQAIVVDKHGICKVAELGLARDVADATNSATNVRIRWGALEALPDPATIATLTWRRSGDSGVEMTAEILAQMASMGHTPGRFSRHSDAWALGIVLWEVWSHGQLPYPDLTDHKVALAVHAGYRLPAPAPCPLAVYRLMHACWQPDVAVRCSAADVLQGLQSVDLAQTAAVRALRPEFRALKTQHVTDPEALTTLLQSGPMDPAQLPVAGAVSGSRNVSVSNQSDSAVDSTGLDHPANPETTRTELSKSAPRRLAPTSSGSAALGNAARRNMTRPAFTGIFHQGQLATQNVGRPSALARSLHHLPIAREADDPYIDVVPVDSLGLAKTFPRLRAPVTGAGAAGSQPETDEDVNAYIQQLDVRLALEALRDNSPSYASMQAHRNEQGTATNATRTVTTDFDPTVREEDPFQGLSPDDFEVQRRPTSASWPHHGKPNETIGLDGDGTPSVEPHQVADQNPKPTAMALALKGAHGDSVKPPAPVSPSDTLPEITVQSLRPMSGTWSHRSPHSARSNSLLRLQQAPMDNVVAAWHEAPVVLSPGARRRSASTEEALRDAPPVDAFSAAPELDTQPLPAPRLEDSETDPVASNPATTAADPALTVIAMPVRTSSPLFTRKHAAVAAEVDASPIAATLERRRFWQLSKSRVQTIADSSAASPSPASGASSRNSTLRRVMSQRNSLVSEQELQELELAAPGTEVQAFHARQRRLVTKQTSVDSEDRLILPSDINRARLTDGGVFVPSPERLHSTSSRSRGSKPDINPPPPGFVPEP
ncbi:uncharacterized protein MONBRDRAFT_12066 [Monosiga brevicollis MX1]|uniref:Protein kinase domain-containing protein n=1 Tax=Monosiga brevicollis TaxID=81824 RepID=A9VB44_MONBE|nr:uncharacterized protein MONBRDRAFT_12066 [Monosiga brevicollis MX1]EDQ85327.1 predicted protein [Monosiga brevicollis MX1]|eukprot:XP_001749948.1 hypothetical protein [Monosiga brevicollis MX1]